MTRCIAERLASWALVVLSASAHPAYPQIRHATVFGTVRDPAGAPVSRARVSSSGILAISDSAGRFELSGLPFGRTVLLIRRLGFTPVDVPWEVSAGRADSVSVVISVLPVDLPGMTTEADRLADTRLADFYRHRRTGIGQFFDRSEIEAKRVHRISDILRRLPGTRISSDRSGRAELRMGRTMGGRDCPPDMWVDGVRAPGLGIDDLPLGDVEALEIYGGPAGIPPEMNSRLGNSACGAIVIWTRLPG